MKKNKFIFATTLMVSFLISMLLTNVNASTGLEGFAVYRDGVGKADINLTWHAAIMDEATSLTTNRPIVHAMGYGKNVDYGTWAEFMGTGKFMGVYRPKPDPAPHDRDIFKGLGRELKGEDIPYTLYDQIYYNTSTAGTWVAPSEITMMRCDGVIEWIYEWCGFRVYGSDALWDIAKNSWFIRDHHSGIMVTPKSQPDYLVLFQHSVPK